VRSGHQVISHGRFQKRHLTRAAAVELGPVGIRVNSINPSVTRTPLTTGMISKAAAAEGSASEEWRELRDAAER